MIDLQLGNYPIIIKPNLGNPILLNLRDYKNRDQVPFKNLSFEALVIASPSHSTKKVLENFHLNIFIQPILKDNGDFSQRRGDLIALHMVEIEIIKKLDFRDQPVLEELNCVVWDINNCVFQFDDVFGKRSELYRVRFQIQDIKIIENLLKASKRDCLLFDIVHDVPNMSDIKQ